MTYVPFLPLFVEFKKNDFRVVEGRKKSTISRLPLKMVVKEIVSRLLEEEGLSHFGKEGIWNGGLSKTLIKKKRDLREMKMVIKKRLVEKEKRSWGEMIHHHFHQSWHQVEVMRKDDLEWWRRS
uniref:Uncharacterized protein n=1 Tax=Tanacetum cinerariifolium TaxID=118510 RepID=A0A6L2KBG1_TANCI|nr:hypothetical protein [Tanacetum cinerariifolium]